MQRLEVKIEPMDLADFYDEVARKLGYTNTDNLKFDCSKIDVSEKIQDAIMSYYRDIKHAGIEEIAMIWLNWGPKAHEDWYDWKVQVEDGFVEEE